MALVKYQGSHDPERALLEALAEVLTDVLRGTTEEERAALLGAHLPQVGLLLRRHGREDGGDKWPSGRRSRHPAGGAAAGAASARAEAGWDPGGIGGAAVAAAEGGGGGGGGGMRAGAGAPPPPLGSGVDRGYGGGGGSGSGGGGSSSVRALQAIQAALMSLSGVPGHLAGAAEAQCSAAALTLTLALAAASGGGGGGGGGRGAGGGGLPPALLQMVSPFRARLEHRGRLGKGGFGSVVAVRSRLDQRLMAVKEVPFRSALPPWAPPEQLEQQHAKMLREVQALAGLDGSPHVVRYYSAWIEPAWEKLGQQLRSRSRAATAGAHGTAAAKAGAAGTASAAAAAARGGGRHRAEGRDQKGNRGVRVGAAAAAGRTMPAPGGGAVGGVGGGAMGHGDDDGAPRMGAASNQARGAPACTLLQPLISTDGCSAGDSSQGATPTGGSQSATPTGACGGISGAAVGVMSPACVIQEVLSSEEEEEEDSGNSSSSSSSSESKGLDSTHSQHGSEGGRALHPRHPSRPALQPPPRPLPIPGSGVPGGIDCAAQPVVMLATSGSETASPELSSGWPMGHPRSRRKVQRSSPLITSLSNSPAGADFSGQIGHVLTRGSSKGGCRMGSGRGGLGEAQSSGSEGSTGDSSSGSSSSEESDSTTDESEEEEEEKEEDEEGHQQVEEEDQECSWTFDRGEDAAAATADVGESSHASSVSSSSSDSDSGGPHGCLTRSNNSKQRPNGGCTTPEWQQRRRRRSTAAAATANVDDTTTGSGGVFDMDCTGSASRGSYGGGGGGRRRRRRHPHDDGSESGESTEGSGSSGSNKGSDGNPGSSKNSGSSYSSSSHESGGSKSGSGGSSSQGSSSGNDDDDDDHDTGSSQSGSHDHPTSGSPHQHGHRYRYRSPTGRLLMVGPTQGQGQPLVAPTRQHRSQTHPQLQRWGSSQPLVWSPPEEEHAVHHHPQHHGKQQQQRHQQRHHRHAARREEAAGMGGGGGGLDLAVLSSIRMWPYMLYISMELVVGPTLTRWLQQRAVRLGGVAHPPEVTVERSIFRQIVTGLVHVHAAGIIHRDLKPANIFLVPIMTSASALNQHRQQQQPAVGALAAAAVTHGSGLPTAQPAAPEAYLVKIGDFGLAVDHSDATIILGAASSSLSAASSSSSTSRSSADQLPPVSAPINSFSSGHGPLRRPPSLPMLRASGDGEDLATPTSGAVPSTRTAPSARTSGVGTASYAAPEQLGQQQQPLYGSSDGGVSYYGPEVDIYPLGLILMELFCVYGTGMERAMAMRDARAGRLPDSFCRTYPEEATLAAACLERDPMRRPTAAQLLVILDMLWGPAGTAAAAAAVPGNGIAAAAAAAAEAPVVGASMADGSGVAGMASPALLRPHSSGPLPLPWRCKAKPLLLLPAPPPSYGRCSGVITEELDPAGSASTSPSYGNAATGAQELACGNGDGGSGSGGTSDTCGSSGNGADVRTVRTGTVLEVGSQTELTWVQGSQPVPLGEPAGFGQLDSNVSQEGQAVPVMATAQAMTTGSDSGVAAEGPGAEALVVVPGAPKAGDTAVVMEGGPMEGPMGHEEDTAALLVELRQAESRAQRLRELLARRGVVPSDAL
ncbi:hypothetical protein Agub_g7024 [Astrephomene gubernaculifera]|uniref:Protein kinase domain-containing protein n=1 Tax=Astrephomene gubernaculifera TaxID=47775 RepID=A0AAD3DRG7_9CHLO|nr:hypothetical protein Agub_g7024 [Astrephomene gubernaculifera]